jgi:hypothetical protein
MNTSTQFAFDEPAHNRHAFEKSKHTDAMKQDWQTTQFI